MSGVASAPSALGRLGIPPWIRACLFDLDGVLTDTARLHAAAWKEVFDEYLATRARDRGETFVPFDAVADYTALVDGKTREDGVRAFLASRGITLPEGQPSDSPLTKTVTGIGNKKNELVLVRLRRGGVTPFEGSVRYVNETRKDGLQCGVVSSSANCRDALAAAGIADLFDVVVDATTAARAHLAGKPAPDTYLAGAHALGVRAGDAAVFEDAPAGVSAGRAGGFGYVVGVDRRNRADTLLACGADVVVSDLGDLIGDDASTLT